jgi:hypothetical protein
MTDSKTGFISDEHLSRLPPLAAAELRRAAPLLPESFHSRLLCLAEEISPLSSEAACEFLKCCSFVASRAGLEGLESWCQEGLDVLRTSEISGIAYYKLETGRSAQLLTRLSPGVDMESVRPLLQTYCLALTGGSVSILPPHCAADGMAAAGEDSSPVFLPEFADRHPNKADNFLWYKVMTTHQVGHIEFGSYDLRSGGTPRILRNLTVAGVEPELGAFLRAFGEPQMAADIFRTVEDARVDSQIMRRYRGIGGIFRAVQAEALTDRPSPAALPLREAFVEVLVSLSLGQSSEQTVPDRLRDAVAAAAPIMEALWAPEATVTDSVEATIALYEAVSRFPNVREEGESVKLLTYTGPVQVEYRGILPLDVEQVTPPDAPAGAEGEDSDSATGGTSAPSGEGADDPDFGMLAADQDDEEESLTAALTKAEQEDLLTAARHRPSSGGDDGDGALEIDGPNTYLYNEWDFRANDYRLRWCRVREMSMDQGSPDFFEATLKEYAGLVAQIRKRFEVLNPEYRRKIKGLPDGEDYDLDAVVDFVIGRKAGQSQDPRVYVRRDKAERDVSVAFLLDMSSSTIEYIGRSQKEGLSGRPVFRDYKDYFEWLQTYDDGQLRPKAFKRIIDLEKESIVLLTRALEAVGDSYGIYGFSGHGRGNVEFYVIKDLEEMFSERTKSRIDAISPRYGTRMGPAIRHTTQVLDRRPAKSKFLFLISDGRPEDYGYGRHGLEKEYAVHDTRMALLEAKWLGITPFCLTLDRAGHDYLRAMCGDMRYEVMADIERLPECLPTLYGRITS